ncbi:MAG: ribonuclease catalytic domain-containing protein [Candidatus Binataceae bacterium]
MAQPTIKFQGALVEYLDRGKLRPGLVVRENGNQLVIADAGGHEKLVQGDLVLLRHGERRTGVDGLAAALAEIGAEREKLGAELDLNLLWEVVHEQNRGFSASELAELFFGRGSTVATAVMLEALLGDRLFFTRRHMEFIARSPDQVERLRTQQSRERLKGEWARRTRALIREVLDGASTSAEEAAELAGELRHYLENPFTRKQEMDALLQQAMPEAAPAELAFDLLERLGSPPDRPRFAMVGGLARNFSEAALREAGDITPRERPAIDESLFAVTIDDEETVEIDDALSCTPQADGGLRVCVHIALAADFVPRGGPMDKEAANRAATVYLPEMIVRMLPEEISCRRASLLAGHQRPVLTTGVLISADGELLERTIYPGQMRIGKRVNYEEADRLLVEDGGDPAGAVVRLLYQAALKLRERRRRAGAILIHRREPKVRVHDGEIQIEIIDAASPSRTLVAEFMVLSNHVAARYASENRLPIIYRVQPNEGPDVAMQRARLSLYPEHHAGIGVECYAQLSSPIRRYADLVMQRQVVAALGEPGKRVYDGGELLTILANTENAEAEAKELERRAKRYWILRYLERHAADLRLSAIVLRDGLSAELVDYTVRGSLHGAPPALDQAQITVRVERVDPLRGYLALAYSGPALKSSEPP